MKRLYTLLLSICFFLSGISQSTNFGKIKIEDVVMKFAQSYIVDYEEDGFIKFEKRKEGFVVSSNRYENGLLYPFKHQIFYSSLDTGYSQLSFRENKGIKPARVSDFIDDYLIKNFNIQILYNYPGWYNDVIDSLEKKQTLDDDELYILGRAYDQAFYDLIRDQDDNPGNQWSLKKDVNCLTESQIEILDLLSKKSIGCYKKLRERDSLYQTSVGPIGIKYANEVVAHFHLMLTFANERARSMKLPVGLYPDNYLIQVRNSLRSCPLNAILLSFNDNDFYPVLYLQQQEKFRRDVHLINYNLIGVDQYIFRFTQRQFDSPGIKLSIDSSLYSSRINEYIRINIEPGIISFSKMIPLMKKAKLASDNSLILTGNKFLLSNTSGKKAFVLGDSYLLKNHWILLNIIENLGSRKLCVPTKFEEPIFKDLNKFFIARKDVWIIK